METVEASSDLIVTVPPSWAAMERIRRIPRPDDRRDFPTVDRPIPPSIHDRNPKGVACAGELDLNRPTLVIGKAYFRLFVSSSLIISSRGRSGTAFPAPRWHLGNFVGVMPWTKIASKEAPRPWAAA